MSDAHTEVLVFIDEFCDPARPVSDDDDLFAVQDIEGDDAGDFMEAFFARFGVDATNYLWYFHHGEEGQNFGAIFHKPIHQRFGRIPITVAVLTEAARTRRWPISYPVHRVPRHRWDILVNQIFVGVILIGLAAGAWIRFAR